MYHANRQTTATIAAMIRSNMIKHCLAPFLDQLGGRQSRRNRDLYTTRLQPFIDLHGDQPPDTITMTMITDWLALMEERGYQPSTLTGYRQAVKTFFRWLHEIGLIPHSPIARMKVGSTNSSRIRLPDAVALQTATALATSWMLESDEPTKIRDGCLFRLATTCGPRSQELRNLTLSEVKRSLQKGGDGWGMYECQSQGKTGQTLIRFGPEVAAGLRRWLAVRPADARINLCLIPTKRTRTRADRNLIWRKMSRSALDSVFVNLCAAAGVAPIRPHTIRHQVGTDIARSSGAKIAAVVLNHADAYNGAATANRYYIHTDQQDVAEALVPRDALDKLFRPRF